jgi:putative phage-type endonuclease
MADLIVERLTGQKASSFSNAAMEWGTEQEPNARAAYSARTGELVEEVGFIDHPAIPMSGASPDGLVGEGCVEYKAPNTATHLEYLLAGKPPERYVTQMQWQMACAGRPWCDFVSYDPRLPERLQLLVVRVPRDDDYIKMLEQEVTIFLQELDDKLNKLEKVTL